MHMKSHRISDLATILIESFDHRKINYIRFHMYQTDMVYISLLFLLLNDKKQVFVILQG